MIPFINLPPLGNPYFSFRKAGDLKKLYPSYPQGGGNAIGKEYDEPTYLTFKLMFEARETDNKTDVTDFDQIPQPLFSTYDKELDERNQYSTYQYLKDMDENVRSEMMLEFVEKWNQLQQNFQWYFQSIEGIADLLKVTPARGKRVGQDVRISIKALEGLDQRVSHLLNLYKKIAWDDIYQRWVLPDIMRYFRLNIYVTEFRTFHTSQYSKALVTNDIEKDEFGRAVEEYNQQLDQYIVQLNTPGAELFADDGPPPNPTTPTPSPTKGKSLFLQKLTNATPTYVLELERCEFDIESLEILPASLDVGTPEIREVNFAIKVGNFKERYINPPLNIFLYDTLVNGFSRTAPTDESVVLGKAGWRKTQALGEEGKAKADTYSPPTHQSGRPWNISGVTATNLKNSIPAWANSSYKSFDEVNPTDPDTWAGNALNLGKAFLENLVEGAIDRATVQKIPGLGVSFNEALTAIQSKNVLSLFSVARRAFGENTEGTLPSQELDNEIVDAQFREFLVDLTKSDATDDESIEIQKAANYILNDKGAWEQIKDYSKATDIISEALSELNIDNKLKNPNSLKTSYANQPYIQQGLQDGLIYEGLPSSVSTQGELSNETGIIDRPESGIAVEQSISQETGIIPQESAGEAVDGDTSLEAGVTTGLGSTDGTIKDGMGTDSPSADLGSNAGDQLSRPDDGLGEAAEGGIDQPKAGEDLGSSTQGGGLNTVNPSQDLGENAGTGIARPGDGLGEEATGGLETGISSEDLGENAGNPLPRPEDGLGGSAKGDLKTTSPSTDLGNNAGQALPRPGEGIGQIIDQKGIEVPKPGEAVDGDPIIGKGLKSTDTTSEATNEDKNIKG